MAEAKPQKKQGATTPTTRDGSGQRQASPRVRDRQPNAAFVDDYEDALLGADVFTKYRYYSAHDKEAQYKSAADLYKSWFRHTDPWIRKTQELLYRAGYYGDAKRSDINWGDKTDDASVKAWASLLRDTAVTNKRGINVTHSQFLDQRIKSLETNGLSPDARLGDRDEPFRFQPSQSADELRRVLSDGMTEILGRALSGAETDAIVQKYMAAEMAAARSQYGVNTSDAGGVAQAPPDLTTIAIAEAERLYPDEVKAKRMANLSEQFLQGIQAGAVDRVF